MHYIVKSSFSAKYINVQSCSTVPTIKIYDLAKYILYRKDFKYIL